MELLQQEIDNVARAYRELDTAIQAVNWLTDCVEI
jgi:prefoldin subunit 5